MCAASSLSRQWSFCGFSDAARDSSRQYMTAVTSWITCQANIMTMREFIFTSEYQWRSIIWDREEIRFFHSADSFKLCCFCTDQCASLLSTCIILKFATGSPKVTIMLMNFACKGYLLYNILLFVWLLGSFSIEVGLFLSSAFSLGFYHLTIFQDRSEMH